MVCCNFFQIWQFIILGNLEFAKTIFEKSEIVKIERRERIFLNSLITGGHVDILRKFEKSQIFAELPFVIGMLDFRSLDVLKWWCEELGERLNYGLEIFRGTPPIPCWYTNQKILIFSEVLFIF